MSREKPCRYCGKMGTLLSDEDCPAKLSNRLGRLPWKLWVLCFVWGIWTAMMGYSAFSKENVSGLLFIIVAYTLGATL